MVCEVSGCHGVLGLWATGARDGLVTSKKQLGLKVKQQGVPVGELGGMKLSAIALMIVFPATVHGCTVQQKFFQASKCSVAAAFIIQDPCGGYDNEKL